MPDQLIQVPVTVVQQTAAVPMAGLDLNTNLLSTRVKDKVLSGIFVPKGCQLAVVPDTSSDTAVVTDITEGVTQLGPWASATGGAPLYLGPFRRNATMSVGVTGQARVAVIVDPLTKHLQFYSENTDITDELADLLTELEDRLLNEADGDEDAMSRLQVTGMGRLYEISETVRIQRPVHFLELTNISLRTSTSAFWTNAMTSGTPAPMVQIGNGGNAGQMTLGCGLSDVTLVTRDVAAGASYDNTNEAFWHKLKVEGGKKYGVRLVTRNRAFEGIGGKFQEFGNNSEAGKDMNNRTAWGIYVSSSDGYISGAVCPINKVGMKFEDISNFLVDKCHPWMGDLLNEAQRYDAAAIEVGTADPDANTASGIRFSHMYIDHGICRHYGSFNVTYSACHWTGGETGIPAFKLYALEPGATGCGLRAVACHISQEHDPDFYKLLPLSGTNGSGAWSGSWSSRLLFDFDVQQGSQLNLPRKVGGTHWFVELDDNGTKDGPFDAMTQHQNAERPVDVRMGAAVPTYVLHSPYNSPVELLVNWRPGGQGASNAGARSYSTTPGVFTGALLNDTTLYALRGYGDNGLDFGGAKGGAYCELRTDEAWQVPPGGGASNSRATKVVFGTTDTGATTPTDKVAITNGGNVVPLAAQQALGSEAKPWLEVFSRRLVMTESADLPATRSELRIRDGRLQVEFENRDLDLGPVDLGGELAWAPVFNCATPGNLSVVYAEQAGTVKFLPGGLALVRARIRFTPTHTTASGSIFLNGMPTLGQPAGTLPDQLLQCLVDSANTDWTVGTTQLTAYINPTSGRLRLSRLGDNKAASEMVVGNFATGLEHTIVIQGVYQVA